MMLLAVVCDASMAGFVSANATPVEPSLATNARLTISDPN